MSRIYDLTPPLIINVLIITIVSISLRLLQLRHQDFGCNTRTLDSQMKSNMYWTLLSFCLLMACSSQEEPADVDMMEDDMQEEMEDQDTEEVMIDSTTYAVITQVNATGDEGAYTFEVGIASPDTGCDQYADWWEVIDPSGSLAYRRILAHSHINEQPFIRSGGRVNIGADDIVIVRAHMNTSGYGRQAYQGSVSGGFEEIILPEDHLPELESQSPLPDDCSF